MDQRETIQEKQRTSEMIHSNQEIFYVYLMGYTYGSVYVGISVDPAQTVKEFNQKQSLRQFGVLLAKTEEMTLIDAIKLQIDLKAYSNKQVRDFFKVK